MAEYLPHHYKSDMKLIFSSPKLFPWPLQYPTAYQITLKLPWFSNFFLSFFCNPHLLDGFCPCFIPGYYPQFSILVWLKKLRWGERRHMKCCGHVTLKRRWWEHPNGEICWLWAPGNVSCFLPRHICNQTFEHDEGCDLISTGTPVTVRELKSHVHLYTLHMPGTFFVLLHNVA